MLLLWIVGSVVVLRPMTSCSASESEFGVTLPLVWLQHSKQDPSRNHQTNSKNPNSMKHPGLVAELMHDLLLSIKASSYSVAINIHPKKHSFPFQTFPTKTSQPKPSPPLAGGGKHSWPNTQ
jgi:hypothetical protein